MREVIRKTLNFLVRRAIKLNMAHTLKRYNRTNPPYEDVFDWREKGDFIFGKGKNITVYGSTSISGDVKVGPNTWIGPFVCLDGSGGLVIGANCSISTAVQVLTHDSVDWALSGGQAAYAKAPVNIGDNCFIGTGAVILKGVTIGEQSVVGANTVVNKSLPARSIAAGNPMKVIGEISVNENGVITKHFFHKKSDLTDN
ncbi:acyltransferase [Bowmanella denitrificans]|uniref:acyltransferase n=1 Tax=Bowmanella denitrificans TaxID=366582 RepID=UPI000C9AA6F4|nr:acyltransferase [Bowmanella denitrificans]